MNEILNLLGKIDRFLTAESFKGITKAVSGYSTELIHIMKTNLNVTIGLFLINFALLYLVFSRFSKSTNNALTAICRKLELTFDEKTDRPIMKRGKQATDKTGKKLFEVRTHVPTFDFSNLPKSFTIRNVHKSVCSNLYNYLNGLLRLLKEGGYIETDSGSVSPKGFPGEFDVMLHDRKKLEEMDMLRKNRWHKEETVNGIKKEYFPEVIIKETEVFLKFPDELKINDEIIDRGVETFEKFYKIKLKPKSTRSKDGTMVFFQYQKALVRFFKYGQTVDAEYESWQKDIVQPMRDHFNEKLSECVFLGELIDPNINLKKAQIYGDLMTSPHFLTAGQTRSGKTKSILSIVCTLAAAYPHCKFLFADGKNSPDYIGLASYFSDYPVAKLHNGDDALIELANVINITVREYEKRQALMDAMIKKNPGCQNYADYNKLIRADDSISEEDKEKHYIHRFFVFIDEFGEFISQINPEKLIPIKGTMFWALAKLLRASASVGISISLASQRYQNTDFPTTLRSNLTTWLIHIVNIRDAELIQLSDEVARLRPGEYILNFPGINCEDTKNKNIHSALPFVGEGKELSNLLRLIGRPQSKHLEFNHDMVYNRGDDGELEKVSPMHLQKLIKQVFLVREGFEVLSQENPETEYINLTAKDREGNFYSIGIVEGREIEDVGFINRLKKQSIANFAKSRKIFFVTGKISHPIERQTFLSGEIGKVYLIRDIDFIRPLKKAMAYYQKGESNPLFKSMLDIEIVEGADPSSLYETNHTDVLINEETLNQIINIANPQQKGDAFENWFIEFEKKLGYDTVSARSVIEEGLIPNIFATARADGGFDLIRWTNKKELKAVGIQCKNQVSKNLSTEIIDKIHKSQKLYSDSGIIIEDVLIVSTGGFTTQATNEAKQMGVKIMNGDMLREKIKSFAQRMNIKNTLLRESSTLYSERLDKDPHARLPSDDENEAQKESNKSEKTVSTIKNMGEYTDFADDIDFEENESEDDESVMIDRSGLEEDDDEVEEIDDEEYELRMRKAVAEINERNKIHRSKSDKSDIDRKEKARKLTKIINPDSDED